MDRGSPGPHRDRLHEGAHERPCLCALAGSEELAHLLRAGRHGLRAVQQRATPGERGARSSSKRPAGPWVRLPTRAAGGQRGVGGARVDGGLDLPGRPTVHTGDPESILARHRQARARRWGSSVSRPYGAYKGPGSAFRCERPSAPGASLLTRKSVSTFSPPDHPDTESLYGGFFASRGLLGRRRTQNAGVSAPRRTGCRYRGRSPRHQCSGRRSSRPASRCARRRCPHSRR